MRHIPICIEINLGAPFCERLKEIFYPQAEWIACYKLVAAKFTRAKRIAKIYYPDLPKHQLLQELNKFSASDITDIFLTDELVRVSNGEKGMVRAKQELQD